MQELSLVVAAHWVELKDDDGVVYFYNPIMGRTQWIEPELPTKIPLDDEGTILIAEDENDRVMPSRTDLLSSGRFDLNGAIRHHGGYIAVSCFPCNHFFLHIPFFRDQGHALISQGCWNTLLQGLTLTSTSCAVIGPIKKLGTP